MQVDSALSNSRYAVMLAPMRVDKTETSDASRISNAEEEEELSCLHLNLVHNRRWLHVLFLDFLGLSIQPLRLQIEQNTTARIIRFARVLEPFIQLFDEIEEHALNSASRPMLAAAQDQTRSGGSIDTHLSYGHFYISALSIAPLRLELTFQMQAACDEAELQAFHPSNALIGPALQLLSLQNASLRLDALVLEEVFESGEALLHRVARSYTLQLVTLLYKLIGSLDLLRIPAAVFADVSGGVRHFFQQVPRTFLSPRSAAGGLVTGTAGLAGGVVGGTTIGVLSTYASMARMAGNLLSQLAMDKDFSYKRQLLQQQQANTTRLGLRQGIRAVRGGFSGGLRGIVMQPMQGTREAGAAGFVRGMGRGLVGAVAKPLAGVFMFASKTAEGLSNDARGVTPNARSPDARSGSVMRVRQPRELGDTPDAVLLPYPRAFKMNF
ncbi:hypothetical protein AB1Y20_022928 [Prymnesium parvum]|uniref:Vacuolar protein sorting-associated protein 13 DH-like domain-containing protein n=1 Tax=Prymnesium parvum TaxID=97485 RepID=A0AB34JEM8_PRYPA